MTAADKKPVARDIMTTEVVSVTTDMTVVEASRYLLEHSVSNVPVVAHDFSRDLLVGFISEKDLMECYAAGSFYENKDLKVSDIMRPHPVSVRPDADLYTLAAIFMQHGFRHLPVTSGGILMGIVSRHDVLRKLFDDYESWSAEADEAQQPPDIKAEFAPRFIIG